MKYSEEDIRKRLSLDLLESEVAEQMLASFYETLDTRMALAIADKLSDEQLAKFENLKESGEDDEAADEWLKAAIPGYETLLDEEADKLLAEIDKNAEDMLKGE